MKRFIVLFLGLMLASGLAFGSLASADELGSATATVYATVDPNIAVTANNPVVDGGRWQFGDYPVYISFHVEANVQEVGLSVAASPLYKGDDPLNEDVAPIPLNETEGVVIDPTHANPKNGGSNVAAYGAEVGSIGDYPALETDVIYFESSQNNHFSQDVGVTVTWTQDDHEKPIGQYSGKVKLIAMLMPGGEG